MDPDGVSKGDAAYQLKNEQYVFVGKGNEVNEIIIDKEFVSFDVSEGDIGNIAKSNEGYIFEKLDEEKQIRKDDVQ